MTVYNISDTVTLHHADMRDALKTLPDNSIDSVVCDPPYHLTSIVKRFGGKNAAPAQYGTDGAFARASKGFMSATWDGGDIAFRAETWAEVLRVLKPGGYCAAFGAPRNFGRLQVAMFEAGFEERDTILNVVDPDDAVVQFLESLNEAQLDAFMRCLGQSDMSGFLAWTFGTGFPKSHDVSKGIDKRPGVTRHAEFAAELRAAMSAKGYTNTFDVAEKVVGRRTGAVANWQKYQFPDAKWWPALRDLLDMDGTKWDAIIAEAERAKLGERGGNLLAVAPGQGNDRSATTLDITAPATDAARQWKGWGTSLKPAFEPIVLARKPLSESTVAANVLRWGTGALNIDGCRIHTSENLNGGAYSGGSKNLSDATSYATGVNAGEYVQPPGRWPANVVHDGSDEVVGAFPTAGASKARFGKRSGKETGTFGEFAGQENVAMGHDDAGGSAARFFYSAKASKRDRDEGLDSLPPAVAGDGAMRDGGRESMPRKNTHPTVKPTALMQWLCRLITPPGGTVLDPFMGSGSTGKAAVYEGFRFIGCEREDEYIKIAEARIAYAALPVAAAVAAQPANVPANDNTPQRDLFGEAA